MFQPELDLYDRLRKVRAAAYGDSNDDEIARLQEALHIATAMLIAQDLIDGDVVSDIADWPAEGTEPSCKPFEVGDWAQHRRQDLDPRRVAAVSPYGDVRLDIGGMPCPTDGWYPRENYENLGPR